MAKSDKGGRERHWFFVNLASLDEEVEVFI